MCVEVYVCVFVCLCVRVCVSFDLLMVFLAHYDLISVVFAHTRTHKHTHKHIHKHDHTHTRTHTHARTHARALTYTNSTRILRLSRVNISTTSTVTLNMHTLRYRSISDTCPHTTQDASWGICRVFLFLLKQGVLS